MKEGIKELFEAAFYEEADVKKLENQLKYFGEEKLRKVLFYLAAGMSIHRIEKAKAEGRYSPYGLVFHLCKHYNQYREQIEPDPE